jgi:hypothetical protein
MFNKCHDRKVLVTITSSTIRHRRTRWAGHVVRHSHYVGSILERKIEGKAPRGRPRDMYLGQVKKDMGKKNHREVKGLAWDGKEWRAAVHQSADCNTIVVVAIFFFNVASCSKRKLA